MGEAHQTTDELRLIAAIGRVSHRQIMARARDLAAPSYRGDPNWSFAMHLFGLSAFHSKFICERMGIDPEGYEVLPHPESLYRDPEPASALLAQAEAPSTSAGGRDDR